MKTNTIAAAALLVIGLAGGFARGQTTACAASGAGVPASQPAFTDIARPLDPADIQVGGMLGHRMEIGITGDLLQRSIDQMVGPFEKKADTDGWPGEHVGKYLHAACLAWANCHDPQLREQLGGRIRQVASRLIAAQDPDGYLGTYAPSALDRLGHLDAQVQSDRPAGLVPQRTGDPAALAACRRMGDNLCARFGAGGTDIATVGYHEGMASTSVLEACVLLYRYTGDAKYLAFCRHIVEAIGNRGPKIIASLRNSGQVSKTANAKAYEMLSNLVGLCELARQTGDMSLVEAPRIGWQSVVDHHLYVTGGSSVAEHYHNPDKFPLAGDISECCVSTTWLQLNLQLLRLTGEAKYAEAAETVLFNHLLGAQDASGSHWSYFTPLEGSKSFGGPFTCCASSGPRGLALTPTWLYTIRSDGLCAETYSPSALTTVLPGGTKLNVQQTTDYPWAGQVKLTLSPSQPAEFTLRLRIPSWCPKAAIRVNGQPVPAEAKPGAYAAVRRLWQPGDTVELSLEMALRSHKDAADNANRVALLYGPLALVFNARFNPACPATRFAAPVSLELAKLNLRIIDAPAAAAFDPSEKLAQIDGVFAVPVQGAKAGQPVRIQLSAFATASMGAACMRRTCWTPSNCRPTGRSRCWRSATRAAPGRATSPGASPMRTRAPTA